MDSVTADLVLGADGLVVDRGSERVLDGVSLTLRRGELVDLRGPSGCGKTTLLQALAKLLPLRAGSLVPAAAGAGCTSGGDGASHAAGAAAWRRRVAYVAQQPVALPGSLRADLLRSFTLRVARGTRPPGDDRLRERLARLGLGSLVLDRPAAELSGGQLARTALLRALLAGPAVLLLDEPDAMLDRAAATLVEAELARFRASGGAVLRASHHAARGAGRVLVLEARGLREG